MPGDEERGRRQGERGEEKTKQLNETLTPPSERYNAIVIQERFRFDQGFQRSKCLVCSR
jgi:hypothetical protein